MELLNIDCTRMHSRIIRKLIDKIAYRLFQESDNLNFSNILSEYQRKIHRQLLLKIPVFSVLNYITDLYPIGLRLFGVSQNISLEDLFNYVRIKVKILDSSIPDNIIITIVFTVEDNKFLLICKSRVIINYSCILLRDDSQIIKTLSISRKCELDFIIKQTTTWNTSNTKILYLQATRNE
jgi:hypothetical protein